MTWCDVCSRRIWFWQKRGESEFMHLRCEQSYDLAGRNAVSLDTCRQSPPNGFEKFITAAEQEKFITAAERAFSLSWEPGRTAAEKVQTIKEIMSEFGLEYKVADGDS